MGAGGEGKPGGVCLQPRLSDGAAAAGARTFIRPLTRAYRRFVACNEDRGAENWSSICRPSRTVLSPFQSPAGTSAFRHK